MSEAQLQQFLVQLQVFSSSVVDGAAADDDEDDDAEVWIRADSKLSTNL